MARNIPWVLMICWFIGACAKQPGPSPEFARAQTQWIDLYKAKHGQAYTDPSVEAILALLSKVDSQSIDKDRALQLQKEIESGQSQAKEQQRQKEEQARAVQALTHNLVSTVQKSEPKGVEEPLVEESSSATNQTKEANSQQLSLGMEKNQFERDFSRCFEYKHPSLVGGRTGGEVWGLKDLSICRELHEGFVQDSVLIMDSKVVAIRPSEELAPKTFVVVDGQLVPSDEREGAGGAKKVP
jgi:hypothetical protein